MELQSVSKHINCSLQTGVTVTVLLSDVQPASASVLFMGFTPYSEHRCVVASFNGERVSSPNFCTLPEFAAKTGAWPMRLQHMSLGIAWHRLASLGIAFSFLNISDTLDPAGMISNCLLIVIDRYWSLLIVIDPIVDIVGSEGVAEAAQAQESARLGAWLYELIHVDTSYASGRLQNVRFAGPGPPILPSTSPFTPLSAEVINEIATKTVLKLRREPGVTMRKSGSLRSYSNNLLHLYTYLIN